MLERMEGGREESGERKKDRRGKKGCGPRKPIDHKN